MSRKRNINAAHASVSRPEDAASDRAEAIYLAIYDALMERRLPPGKRLPEEHLAEIFGVSRTLIRQALQRLAHEHLVIVEHNRGARVAEPSIAEVRHLYEVRRLIECAVLAEGGLRLTRARIASLRRLVAQEAKAISLGDAAVAMQLSARFHIDLMEALGNPVLNDILRDLMARGNVAIALYELDGRAPCRCEDHHQILHHLANGDTAMAIDVMRRHLTEIEESLTLSRSARRPVDLASIFAGSDETIRR